MLEYFLSKNQTKQKSLDIGVTNNGKTWNVTNSFFSGAGDRSFVHARPGLYHQYTLVPKTLFFITAILV